MSVTSSKVVIIGSGLVGTSIAYSSVIQGICTELVLIDAKKEKAKGEVMDLSHGLPFTSPMEIRGGEYEDCIGANVIVITAGSNQKPGESRLALAQKNVDILRSILEQILRVEQQAILLLVTNPVDVLTTITRSYSELKANRVIGSGTVLDTARFRYILSQHCQISPGSVHAYVVGEHGDSEVPLFSSVSVAGTPFSLLCQECNRSCGRDYQKEVIAEVRKAAYEIINRKGATYFGIGLSCTRILKAILNDERSVLTVSALLDDQYKEFGVAISVPSVLGKEGILRRLPLSITETENAQFLKSVRAIQESVHQIK
ncbi:L-lactate dehydrogenase [Desulfosporosinus nitroreducens]|uniref:L-lactate dehydrogenase n=1 Tax=Desulfosporosinus nitroreducens TaxID=2018668 RepID=A0ABT8QWY5_9FIRM|nr:L-lactate dehydrogenase [Desulfosporosinus nitroreducens]MCO1604499.1 L-lactate dehydrogenase [Desulfosporosinus nitroreducens]MDO0825853.1 L-lactate dehydrogenase [Desulfosporosinus nitroreducens]